MTLIRMFSVIGFFVCVLQTANAATLSIGNGTTIGLVPDNTYSHMTGKVDTRVTLVSGHDSIVLLASGIVETDIGNIDISHETTNITLSTDYNIYTDGDLFLDYSVFSLNQKLFIGENISITAPNVTIFSFDDTQTLPDLLDTTIYSNLHNNLNTFGDILVFSNTPVLSGTFEATGHLYIGNYAALQPIPLPTSIALLISGLAMLGGGKTVTRFLKRAGTI